MASTQTEKLTMLLPLKFRRRVEPLLEVLGIMKEVKSYETIAGMIPSVARGFIMREGRLERPVEMVSGARVPFRLQLQVRLPPRCASSTAAPSRTSGTPRSCSIGAPTSIR